MNKKCLHKPEPWSKIDSLSQIFPNMVPGSALAHAQCTRVTSFIITISNFEVIIISMYDADFSKKKKKDAMEQRNLNVGREKKKKRKKKVLLC